MADMEEYLRCLDVIAQTNHIVDAHRLIFLDETAAYVAESEAQIADKDAEKIGDKVEEEPAGPAVQNHEILVSENNKEIELVIDDVNKETIDEPENLIE